MLIERHVFNLNEVGEKSFLEIKNECLHNFASNLKEALTTTNSSIRNFWVTKGSIANYKIFQDNFGTKIKYNTKSIVFEETLHNELDNPWSLRRTCMDHYNLEYVPATADTSDYYKYSNRNVECCEKCDEFVSSKLDKNLAEENVRNFYNAFGKGEFPFMTITIIRIGNKDHYFYDIHR